MSKKRKVIVTVLLGVLIAILGFLAIYSVFAIINGRQFALNAETYKKATLISLRIFLVRLLNLILASVTLILIWKK